MAFDASSLPGFYDHLQGSDLGAVGTRIATWEGPGLLTLDQATSSRQPIVGVDEHGYKYADFDGSDDVLRSTNETFAMAKPGVTLYAVYRLKSYGSTSFDYVLLSTVSDSATQVRACIRIDSNKPSVSARRLDADTSNDTLVGTVTLSDNRMVVHTGLIDWSDSAAYVLIDGADAGSDTTFLTSGLSSDTPPALVSIGGRDGSAYAPIQLYEALFYEVVHNADERAKVHSYFQSKYPATVTVADYVQAGLNLVGTLLTTGVLVRRPAHVRLANIALAGTTTTFRSITRSVAGAITAAGARLNRYDKSAAGSLQPAGVHSRRIDKVRDAILSPAGALRRGVSVIYGGSVQAAGVALSGFLGRVFGRPGIVALTVRTRGILRLRVRRPN